MRELTQVEAEQVCAANGLEIILVSAIVGVKAGGMIGALILSCYGKQYDNPICYFAPGAVIGLALGLGFAGWVVSQS